MVMLMTLPISALALATALAQVPNPAAATAAARDAKAKTEAAQQKNAEALTPQAPRPAEQPPAAPGAPTATPGSQPPPPPAQGAGYSYDPAGRRDPFVSLTGRGGDVPIPGGMRPGGVPGLLVAEVTLKGLLKSRGAFIALVQSPDNRTYIIKAGDKLFDGVVKAVTQDAVVFSQDVNDPLSLVKQREVRKSIRPEAR
jgi:Tfp pilus assembly protein PilP